MRRNLNPGALLAPLPAVLVTVGTGDRANVLTVGWCGILSTNPPRTYISLRPSRHSHALLRENGEFVINLTRASQARSVDYAGIYTGAKVDKLSALGLHTEPSIKVAPPTLSDCPLALECRVIEVRSSGTHDVFVADIVSVSCDEKLIDERGRICLERAELLVYAHGEYFALGEPLGHFGFSTDKEGKAREKNKGKLPRAEKKRVKDGKSTDKGKSGEVAAAAKSRGAQHRERQQSLQEQTASTSALDAPDKARFYEPFLKKKRGGRKK